MAAAPQNILGKIHEKVVEKNGKKTVKKDEKLWKTVKNSEKGWKTAEKQRKRQKTTKTAKNAGKRPKTVKNGENYSGGRLQVFFALGTGLLLSCTRWTSLDSTQGHRVQVHEHEHLPGQGGHELKLHEEENKYIDAKKYLLSSVI